LRGDRRPKGTPLTQGFTMAPFVRGGLDQDVDRGDGREDPPVPYFHVVFTVPAPVAEIAFHNKAVVYTILFRAATEALRSVAADPRYLGAEIGAIAVLHTWGQALHHHPHSEYLALSSP
jgi:hypothetical protein